MDGARSLVLPAWHHGQLCLSLAALVSVAACRDDLSPMHGSRPVASRALLASRTVRPTSIRPEEQMFADFASSVPSSGAFFVDDNGTVVVWVRDSADDKNAMSAGVAELSKMRARRLRISASNVAVRRAQFTFWQLAAWRDAIFENELGRDGVIRLDMNEAVNRVDVTFDRNTALSVRHAVTLRLDSLGIDTSAVRLLEGDRLSKLVGKTTANRRRFPSTIDDYDSTIVGGLQFTEKHSSDTTQTFLCSLGIVLDYSGTRSFVTVSHCSATEFAIDGAYANQSTGADRRIGHETADPSGYGCDLSRRTCRGSDASIYTIESGIQSEVGLIAKTTSSSSTWGTSGSVSWDTTNPYFIVTWSSCDCVYGQVVDKMGRTTGWTTGSITNTCVDVEDTEMSHIITCSMLTNMPSTGGDSGGPVFIPLTSAYDVNVNFAGIMFAGDTVNHINAFSPISRIVLDLTGSWAVVRPANLSTPSVSGEVVSGTPGITWGAVSGAVYYQVWRQWYRYPSETGSAGWEYLGHQSSEFWDSTMSVDLYTGTTIPNFSTEGYVEYKVVAFNTKDYSGESTVKYFRLAPP